MSDNLEALRSDILELRRKRNSMRAWATTNSDSPLLRAMAAEAGQSVEAFKRHAGELADNAEAQLAFLENAEAKIVGIKTQMAADVERLATLKAERAELLLQMTPEEQRAFEEEERAIEEEERAIEEEDSVDARWDELVDEMRRWERQIDRVWAGIESWLRMNGFELLARQVAKAEAHWPKDWRMEHWRKARKAQLKIENRQKKLLEDVVQQVEVARLQLFAK